MLVTGVLVGRKPGVLRKYVRNTRAGINRLAKGCVPESDFDIYIKRIRGRIAHVNHLNPNSAYALEQQFLSVQLERASRPNLKSVILTR